MQVTEIELYNALKQKLGDQQAETLVGYVKSEVSQKFSDNKSLFATKEDVANAKVDIIKWIVGVGFLQLAAVIGGLYAVVRIVVEK